MAARKHIAGGIDFVIHGYPAVPSVRPGEKLILHVSTDKPAFRVEFYRQGRTLSPMGNLGVGRQRGFKYGAGSPDQDWGWPAYEFPIPLEWPSGSYVAMLIEVDPGGDERAPDFTNPDGTEARALFVVRSAQPGRSTPILYKLSLATYHAYNGTGYGSLYAEALWSGDQPFPGFKVTTRRPGGGTGGVVMPGTHADYYDPASMRGTFAHFDVPFIRWLEENGYKVDYCTDFDLNTDRDLLEPYNLLLCVGHDEYWSDAMRSNIESFIGRGGNVAILSGNTAGWRIHFTDDNTGFSCAKVKPTTRDGDSWQRDEWQEIDPEERVLGVSWAKGGGWWDGKRPTLGFTVQHADHWVYEGTGLKDGDVFGDDESFPVIGFECDGTEYIRRHGFAVPTGAQGTPATFCILGVADLGDGWIVFRRGAAATMGLYTSNRGGIVFEAATTDWPIVVPRNKQVASITRNVLDHLQLRSLRLIGPLPSRGGQLVAGVGESVFFQADTSNLSFRDSAHYSWEVAGAHYDPDDQPTLTVKIPPRVAPVTVSLTVSQESGPVAFGTLTFMPLTKEESLQHEVCTLLREMAMPAEPSYPLVVPTANPLSLKEGVVAVHVPWIRDRAARLERVAGELLALWEKSGRSSIELYPQKHMPLPWQNMATEKG